jgi:tripartite-type tricarboxylate transporter receptor subunit TctC
MKFTTCLTALVLSFAAAAPAARADEGFPSQPIRIIVPFQAGSSPDAAMRYFAPQLSEILKQPVVIDNRPGAGGLLGADALAKAKPDGYTIGYLSSQHQLHPYMIEKMPYDPMTAFSMIAALGRNAQVLIVPPTHPSNDLKGFVAAAKSRSGTVKYGSGGIGSPAHMAGHLFGRHAGLQTVHVPYKGAPEAVTALLGGHLDYVAATAGVAIPLVKAGKAKALAVTSDTRHPVLPDVPTLRESLPNGPVLEPWSVVVAPAKTPAAVVERLNLAFNQVLENKRTVDFYATTGGEALVFTPKATDAFYREEARRLAQWVDELGLKKQ